MQIACPKCKTLYQIEPAAVGSNGRSVRCARCQDVWYVPPAGQIPEPPRPGTTAAAAKAEHEDIASFSAELGAPPIEPAQPSTAEAPAAASKAGPPSDEPTETKAPAAGADAETAEPAPVTLAEVTIPVEDAPSIVPDNSEDALPGDRRLDSTKSDVEAVAAKRARAAKRRRRVPVSLVIITLAIAVAALLGLRKDVVRHVPQMASFYNAIHLPVNLRGVAFTDLKIGNEIHDGVPVLVVEGAIVSITSKPVDVPRIRFSIRNPAGAEIYSWTVQPPQPVLEPFDSMPFRTRLAAPPAEAHDVQVRFFTRRDAVANR